MKNSRISIVKSEISPYLRLVNICCLIFVTYFSASDDERERLINSRKLRGSVSYLIYITLFIINPHYVLQTVWHYRRLYIERGLSAGTIDFEAWDGVSTAYPVVTINTGAHLDLSISKFSQLFCDDSRDHENKKHAQNKESFHGSNGIGNFGLKSFGYDYYFEKKW